MSIRLAVLAGARPNFMKVAPLMKALAPDHSFETSLIHTGQHYDDAMSGRFFRDLELPEPDYNLQVGSGTHAQQTAEVMKRLEPVLQELNPCGLVVVGDVNSTLAGALVASKVGIRVIHVEAGLRSFDRTMPEEINRVVTDSISDLLLITEESARENLLREGIRENRIYFVGNLMIDSPLQHSAALDRNLLPTLGVSEDRYGAVTIHRPSNVDNERQLLEITEALNVIADDLPLYWPLHPRTRARIESSRVELSDRVHLLTPMGYVDFLCLQKYSEAVLTDSGGVQEETTAFGVPCLTLRENTERPATLTYGTNRLAGVGRESVLTAWRQLDFESRNHQIPPLWDGHSAERCVDVLRMFFQ
jgi:UDP-N-acetylglucosamine 2-epimerase (non-hydrolysing)